MKGKDMNRREFIKLGTLFAVSLVLPKFISDMEIPTGAAEGIKASIADGGWHHIAVTPDNFYLDGKKVSGIHGVRLARGSVMIEEEDIAVFLIDDLHEEFTISCWVQAPLQGNLL